MSACKEQRDEQPEIRGRIDCRSLVYSSLRLELNVRKGHLQLSRSVFVSMHSHALADLKP